jgi:porin
LGAALLCVAGPAAAQNADQAPKKAVAAAPAASPIERPAVTAAPVHDGTAPPSVEEDAAEEEAPAIDLSVVYTAEAMRNARGGLGRGTRYLDNLDVTLRIDAGRAFGWRGATLFAYGLYNNGEPFSEDLVGAAQGASNIETGVRAARLYEAWIEQRFASGRASVKFGLYDLNSEFDAIEAAALFINPSHGIGPDFSQSGRNGPSIFPVTSLALRGDYKIDDRWLVRAAILDGVPGDPERPRRTSIKLGGDDGALGVVELNYADDGTRAGAGYWRYTGRFEIFSGEPGSSRGNDGLYAFVERRLTQERGDSEQGLAGWVRLGFADERLNPVKHYLGGGFTYTGPFPGRDEDQAGVAVGWAEFGTPFRRSSASSGDPLDAREVIIEATYRAPVTSWLTLQPDLQYVINPGGRSAASNALILGLRAELGF